MFAGGEGTNSNEVAQFCRTAIAFSYLYEAMECAEYWEDTTHEPHAIRVCGPITGLRHELSVGWSEGECFVVEQDPRCRDGAIYNDVLDNYEKSQDCARSLRHITQEDFEPQFVLSRFLLSDVWMVAKKEEFLEWKPMVDAVLWDVGGVISDQSVFWKKRDDLAKKFGVPVEKLVQYSNEHRKEVDLGGMSEEAFWRSALIFAGVSPARLKNPEGYAELWPYVHPIEGTVEIMDALKKRKIPQGILSNDSKELGELKRQKLYPQIFEDSKSIVLSGELGMIKPDPKIYKEALRRIQMENKPERVLFIDDKEKYCKGAWDLGMRCIVFQDAQQLREELRELGLSLP